MSGFCVDWCPGGKGLIVTWRQILICDMTRESMHMGESKHICVWTYVCKRTCVSVCMWLFTCAYVRMQQLHLNNCMHMWIIMCACAPMYTYICSFSTCMCDVYVYMFVYMCKCMYVCVCMSICIYVWTVCVCVYVCMNMYIWVCICVYMYMYIYVYMYICVYVCVCMYRYIYTHKIFLLDLLYSISWHFILLCLTIIQFVLNWHKRTFCPSVRTHLYICIFVYLLK